MELNYEIRYAYAEVECILKWLGEKYTNKLPEEVMKKIKEEKKFAYRPEIDFSRPLEDQVRQETKNIIAYLNYNYWVTDEKKKQKIKDAIKENKRRERIREIEMKSKINNQSTVTASIENALKNI